MEPVGWNVSLHGGHSRAYCDHADSTLEELLDAAVARGMTVYGVTEHAPRVEAHRLYDEEIALGWDVATLDRMFSAYARTLEALQARYAGRLDVVRGFEAEVIPEDRYVDVMLGYREQYRFEYLVGSVHWVAGHIIDYRREHFEAALESCGGLEALAVRYYETVAEMARALRPEVLGHFDLIRKYAPDEASIATPSIRAAASAALDAIRDAGCILDINTAGYRRGFGRPYPAPWILEAVRERGIPCCFGDDSHSVAQVGAGIAEARQYLIDHGVDEVIVLRHVDGRLERGRVPLACG
jgi:histidinol-phosphatase (PHP family)